MPLVPMFFQASTKQVALEALLKGYLKYPGICFVESEGTLLWVNQDNTIRTIAGYHQITDVQYHSGVLSFWSGDTELLSLNIAVDPETVQEVVDTVTGTLDLNSYAKSEYVIHLLDDKIGDLGDKTDVVDYIAGLSYDSLADTPIQNIYGSLTKVIIAFDLEDGVYKVNGPFQIGGQFQTVQTVSNGTFLIVQHSELTTTITQLSGNAVRVYHMDTDGNCRTDKYATEAWIREQDFISSKEVKEYVKALVLETIVETVDQVLDERLNAALETKIGGIDSNDLASIFT